ncbi:MAG: hypothetical protein M5U34_46025 [Chloroflexi bacterium]|nr:hypothetical protein [Chloroflexota bacterium]
MRFAHIFGIPVGIVANNGLLFSESAQKAAHLFNSAGSGAPLLFLQNITGFMVGRQFERWRDCKGWGENGNGRFTVNVPRITLFHGVSHGAAQLWHERPGL